MSHLSYSVTKTRNAYMVNWITIAKKNLLKYTINKSNINL